MSSNRALLLIPLAAAMLALAALDAPILAAIELMGLQDDAERLAPLFATGLAAGGFVVLVAVLIGFVGSTTRAERYRPYVEALTPFAAEFGRGVGETPEGLVIHIQRDGQRVEVRVNPGPGGRITVVSSPPARQALTWLRQGVSPPPAAVQWREVDRTERWQLRAELPAMARPLLADGALMEVVGRFFSFPEGASITHTLGGILLEANLPRADDAQSLVRLAAEIAFRLRRVNG